MEVETMDILKVLKENPVGLKRSEIVEILNLDSAYLTNKLQTFKKKSLVKLADRKRWILTETEEKSSETKQKIDSSKILEKLISLETLKIKIESIKDKVKLIANYYFSKGNEEKYKCWSSVITYFDEIISALDNAKNCLKSYDLECFKEKVNKVKELIKEIVDKLLECA